MRSDAQSDSRPAALAALLVLAGGLWAGAEAAKAAEASALAVCVAADNVPLSSGTARDARGLDVRIARALASELGRELRIVPFESDYEKESSLAQELNALLSAGVCDLASGFPLLAADIGPPSRASQRTPDYPGAARKRERPFVPLGPLVASRAYYRAALGVVTQRGDADPHSPQALKDSGWRIGAVSGSLSSAWLNVVRNGALRPSMVSLGQREDPLALLAGDRIDAALVPLTHWDAWRAAHPDTRYRVPLRKLLSLHLGFVARDTHADLIDRLNALIARTRANGELASWATAEGVSWIEPAEPEITRGFSLAELAAD